MANLRIIENGEEINIDIIKDNKLKIINYNQYLLLYKHFYQKENIFIENREITKKDSMFIDISSISNIIKELEFKKGTLLYDYITIKSSEIDIDQKEKFYNSFLEQVDLLKNSLNVNFEIESEDNIDKVLLQNIDININFNELFDSINIILEYIIKNNITKNYIIIYNSQLITLKFPYDNYYLFDINPYLPMDKYNILIVNEFINFDSERLINYIENIWPIEYYDNEIDNLLDQYFKYVFPVKEFVTNNEKLYLLAIILRKTYHLSQNIVCDKLVLNSIIKSFVDTF